MPQERTSDTGETVSSEATDRVDANGVEGSTSRDTTRAESADKAAPVERPTIDPARFVSRVTRAIEFADQRGGGPVEMRLSPPELGSLQVKIQVKDGVMTAKLEVETPAARNALLDNLRRYATGSNNSRSASTSSRSKSVTNSSNAAATGASSKTTGSKPNSNSKLAANRVSSVNRRRR